MKNIAATVVSILGVCSGNAFATLISLGPISLGGQGLGSVQTVLTIQSPGSSSTETGCVASGVGGVLVKGAAACPGGGHSVEAPSLEVTSRRKITLFLRPLWD